MAQITTGDLPIHPRRSGTSPSATSQMAVTLSCQDLALICNISLEAERLIHGKPSGIDNSVCTHGKLKRSFFLSSKCKNPVTSDELNKLTQLQSSLKKHNSFLQVTFSLVLPLLLPKLPIFNL